MHAMVMEAPRAPLVLRELPDPRPAAEQLLVEVSACGVCRTDLHIIEGDLADPVLPLVPGHQIVGRVLEAGNEASGFRAGDRVGVPWLGGTCGACRYCVGERENLCESARFTGYHLPGGYAERALVDHRYALSIPEGFDDVHAAPLLCAGLIGYRALVLAGDAPRLGLYGFGASAHIVLQVARYQGREVYAFTRDGDERGQRFARDLGATWAGGSGAAPPVALDAAIVFAPVGALVPRALRALAPGGTVVCAGIHMSDIPAFPYEWLWKERSIRSVANLTRADGEAFLALAPRAGVRVATTTFPLEHANEALAAVRDGALDGAAVLVVGR